MALAYNALSFRWNSSHPTEWFGCAYSREKGARLSKILFHLGKEIET
jgi:hypothetical protein